ncbi:MAG TPA: hypothetical protein VGF94_25750 [Kofleriaceae bacterium]|jgi:hypothetical protein
MGLIESVLRRWGYVRLGRYGLVLGPDDRIVALQPELPPAPHPVAPPPVVDEDEWEWEIAMARARAQGAEAAPKPTPALAVVRPVAPPRPVVPRPSGLPGMPPRRFPRATEGEPMLEPVLELDAELIEDATVRTLAVPPAHDDDTSPGLLAPPPPRRVASRSR